MGIDINDIKEYAEIGTELGNFWKDAGMTKEESGELAIDVLRAMGDIEKLGFKGYMDFVRINGKLKGDKNAVRRACFGIMIGPLLLEALSRERK